MNKPILFGSGGGPDEPTVKPVSFRSEDTVEFNLAIMEGPAAGLHNGPRSFYLGDTTFMSPNGGNNFKPFELHVYNGADVATPVRNALGGVTSNSTVNVQLAQNVPIVRTTSSSLRNQIDVLELRFQVQNLMSSDAEGNQLFNTLYLNIEYRQSGTTTWLPFTGTTTWSYTGRLQGSVQELKRQVPRVSTDWEIRVTKLNPDNQQYVFADVNWESFQATTQQNRSYDNLVLVRGLSSASEQLNGIPSMSGVWDGLLCKIPSNYDPVTRYYAGVWDGTFKLGFTDNPVWCLYEMLTNGRFGAKAYYPNLQVDRFSFYLAAQWCDQLVQRPVGGYQPRYTYNDLIQEGRQGLQLLHYVAGIFGGVLVEDSNGTVLLKVDMPGTPKQIFGPESVGTDRFNYQYTDIEGRLNHVLVTYTNPDLGWEDDVREVYIQSYINRNGKNSSEFAAVGCIDVYEAQRRAYLMLLTANTEVTTVTFKTARQSLLLDAYDIIGITDPDMRWGLSGRILEVAGGIIYLRDPLLVPVNTDMTLQVQSPTGITSLTVRSPVANTKQLQITAGALPLDLPSRAQFALTEASIGLVKPFRILSIAEDDNDPDMAVITALEINPSKYGDADALVSSGSVNYSGTPLPPGNPQNIQVSSGTAQLLIHTDGTIESRIHVSWSMTPPGQVTVFYRRLNGDQFSQISATGGFVYIPNVVDDADYVIELQTYDSNGQPLFRTPSIVHRVVGKTQIPSTPQGWTASHSYDTITLTGQKHPDVDFAAFNIYGATAANTNLTLLASVSATTYTRQVPAGDPYTRYKVTAVDTTGNESLTTAFLDVVPDPSDLDSLFQAAGVAVPKVVSNFPASGNIGDVIYLTTQQKLYQWDGTNWTTQIDGADIITGTLIAGLFAAGAIKASDIDIDNTLTISALGAGFSMGKQSATDFAAPGLYMGRDLNLSGGTGFGFLMGRTSLSGVQEYIQNTDDTGLSIVNASFGLLLDQSTVAPIKATTTQTINLAAGVKTVNLTLVSGGGGGAPGASPTTAAQPGGTTTVQLWNGAIYTGQSWTVSGGAAGTVSSLSAGASSAWGTGGSPGAQSYYTGRGDIFHPALPGGNASGNAGGGGGGYPAGHGGATGKVLYSGPIDVSGLATPRLVITQVGAGGARGLTTVSTNVTNGGDGSPGFVYVTQVTQSVVPSGVIPLYPTAKGQFTKAAGVTGASIFPNLGAGLWTLHALNSDTLDMSISYSSVGQVINAILARSVTFISDTRPVVVYGGSLNRTIDYAFHRMKV